MNCCTDTRYLEDFEKILEEHNITRVYSPNKFTGKPGDLEMLIAVGHVPDWEAAIKAVQDYTGAKVAIFKEMDYSRNIIYDKGVFYTKDSDI